MYKDGSPQVIRLQGLLAILNHLMAATTDGGSYGFCTFDEALHIFEAFLPDMKYISKEEFRDILLHHDYGLSVYVIKSPISGTRYVVQKAQNCQLHWFMEEFISTPTSMPDKLPRIDKNHENVKQIINSMDTEYDQKCAKVHVCSDKSLREVKQLGFKQQNITEDTIHIIEAANEVENAKVAASDMVKLSLSAKSSKISEQIQETHALLKLKKDEYSERHLGDLEEAKFVLEERLTHVLKLQNPETAYEKQCIQQAIKRRADDPILQNRIKEG